MSKILIALSGGVDSSVAASLLLEQGYQVEGVHMRHALQISPEEERDAEKAADFLGIPLHRLDIDAHFREIVDRFVADYLAAKTPNPCALCNRKIKFGVLVDFAQSLGIDEFATGHYARCVETDRGRGVSHALMRGRDVTKDQSYLLYGIDRSHLPKLRFPLGDFLKSEVRDRAASLGLHVSAKKDSQDICFVPPHGHAEFVRARSAGKHTAGQFVSTGGTILAQHHGYEHFTVGQRKGLKTGFGGRMYVVRIEPDSGRIVLGTRDDLAVTSLWTDEVRWLEEPIVERPFRCDVKIRYRNRPEPATVVLRECHFPAQLVMEIVFDHPKYGVAPGQIAVCYHGDRVLGGGTISRTN